MITKIEKNQSHSSNKGSSSNVVNYLEKENSNVDFSKQEYFFNQHSDKISALQAETILDNHSKGLKKNETKFYMVTISPSQDNNKFKGELSAIKNDKDLKVFTNKVMNEYAANFGRKFKNGEDLKGEDLVYFAKLERNRTYKYSNVKDREIIISNKNTLKKIENLKTKFLKTSDKSKNINDDINSLKSKLILNDRGKVIKEGVLKNGDNRHVHILVHRLDKTKTFKLSPNSNSKGSKNHIVNIGKESKKVKSGFNRIEFSKRVETLFDKEFSYNRHYTQSLKYQLNPSMLMALASNPIEVSKAKTISLIKNQVLKHIEDGAAKKVLGIATSDPRKIPKKTVNKLQKESIKIFLKSMKAAKYTNPVTAAIDATQTAFKIVGSQISRGAGL